MEELIRQIIGKGIKTVIAVTGGGAGVLEELTQYGGASAIFVNGVVPWNQAALENFIGGKPDKYCSESTARAMAVRAYEDARKIAGTVDVVGIGLTCKLAALNEREGRDHVIYVASQTHDTTTTYKSELPQGVLRSVESKIASQMALLALAEAVGAEYDGGIIPFKKCTPQDRSIVSLWVGHSQGTQVQGIGNDTQPRLMMSASFNPLHDGHKKVMRIASELTGRKVALELCITNAAKPNLDYLTIEERVENLKMRLTPQDREILSGLFLTNTGKFLEKCEIFPDTTFIVGADTYNRIGDPKFYGDSETATDAIFEYMGTRGAHFLVFQRKGVEVTHTSAKLKAISSIVPTSVYEDEGHSSTQERKKL